MSDGLTKGLANLKRQVNERFPNRDKTSDGSWGDEAHKLETSGHNPDDTAGSKAAWNGDPDSTPEVRAWDQDSDLREDGVTAQNLVDHIRKLPGLSSVIRYMIYDRKMYHSRNGFEPTAYTGSSPHTEHIHYEGAWTQEADNNTTYDYRLDELGDLPVTDADMQKLAGYIAKALLQSDTVPVANADGTPNSWMTQTALGYMTVKSREIAATLQEVHDVLIALEARQ